VRAAVDIQTDPTNGPHRAGCAQRHNNHTQAIEISHTLTCKSRSVQTCLAWFKNDHTSGFVSTVKAVSPRALFRIPAEQPTALNHGGTGSRLLCTCLVSLVSLRHSGSAPLIHWNAHFRRFGARPHGTPHYRWLRRGPHHAIAVTAMCFVHRSLAMRRCTKRLPCGRRLSCQHPGGCEPLRGRWTPAPGCPAGVFVSY